MQVFAADNMLNLHHAAVPMVNPYIVALYVGWGYPVDMACRHLT